MKKRKIQQQHRIYNLIVRQFEDGITFKIKFQIENSVYRLPAKTILWETLLKLKQNLYYADEV